MANIISGRTRILFAVIAQSLSKGKGDSIISRAVSFVLRKNKEKTKED